MHPTVSFLAIIECTDDLAIREGVTCRRVFGPNQKELNACGGGGRRCGTVGAAAGTQQCQAALVRVNTKMPAITSTVPAAIQP